MSSESSIPHTLGYLGQEFCPISSQRAQTSVQLVHYSQLCDWTCGPASIRILTQSLCGHAPSEEVLIELLNTNSTVGTTIENMRTIRDWLAKEWRLESVCRSEGKIDDLVVLMKAGFLVMLNFQHPPPDSVGHYAVVKAVSEKTLTLCDPFSGPDCVMSLEPSSDCKQSSAFNLPESVLAGPTLNWISDEGVRGWYLGVRKLRS